MIKTVLISMAFGASVFALDHAQAAAKHGCPLAAPGEWAAWVDAMPGPRGPTLHVTGRVVTPTAGYGLKLRDAGANRKPPVIRTFELIVLPPSGMAAQMISTNAVRHSVRLPPLKPPYELPFKAVRITCGGRTIATIEPVSVAH